MTSKGKFMVMIDGEIQDEPHLSVKGAKDWVIKVAKENNWDDDTDIEILQIVEDLKLIRDPQYKFEVNK